MDLFRNSHAWWLHAVSTTADLAPGLQSRLPPVNMYICMYVSSWLLEEGNTDFTMPLLTMTTAANHRKASQKWSPKESNEP